MIFDSGFAHAWGWDEILYFAVPAVLVLFWIRWIEQRSKARKETAEEVGTTDAGPDQQERTDTTGGG